MTTMKEMFRLALPVNTLKIASEIYKYLNL